MTMRLALHIFRKDVRRLWWEITVTLGLTAYLAQLDSNRADYLPGPMEGLMNLLLPLAWAYLIALCVHQEAIVGDRQFWLTRPYPREALLFAKTLFAIAFVHLPSFLADCFVVQARGFQPLDFMSVLAGKQVTFALAITVPAIALAATTKNLTQLASAGLAALVGWLLLAATPSIPWSNADTVLQGTVIGIIAAGSTTIIALQYFRRRTALSRFVGVTALTAGLAVAAYLPRKVTAVVRCRDSNGVSIAFERHGEPMPESLRFQPPRDVVAVLPIKVSSAAGDTAVYFEALGMEITANDGRRWAMLSRPSRGGLPRQPDAVSAHVVLPPEKQNGWMLIHLDHPVQSQIAGKLVRISAQFTATSFSRGSTTVLNVDEPYAGAAGIGRCTTQIVRQFYSRENLLKVMCESPRDIPLPTNADLVQPSTGSRWHQRLGDARTAVTYPADQWLSPVNRRQTFFHIIDGPEQGKGSQWLVPRSALAGARIELTPEHDRGCGIVAFEAVDIDLRSYRLKPLQGGGMLGRQ
jgi:hypothetical protein